MSYCIRFFTNLKLPKNERNYNPLSVHELNESMKRLTRLAQLQDFSKENSILTKNESLNCKDRLSSRSPFLDNDGLLPCWR